MLLSGVSLSSYAIKNNGASHVWLRKTAARPNQEAGACGVVLGLQKVL